MCSRRKYEKNFSLPDPDLGRRPGSRPPPVGAIARWVVRKGVASEAQAKSIAFLIARAIGARGLKPRYVMTGALQELSRYLQQEVDDILTAVHEGKWKGPVGKKSGK